MVDDWLMAKPVMVTLGRTACAEALENSDHLLSLQCKASADMPRGVRAHAVEAYSPGFRLYIEHPPAPSTQDCTAMGGEVSEGE